MNPEDKEKLLRELLRLPNETEWVEFKEARTNFNFEELGKYFSAISNEANLQKKPCGWLVLGVENQQHRIVGTQFARDEKKQNGLKQNVAENATQNLTLRSIIDLKLPEGRVLMFQIPPAPSGIPIAWKGHYYGRNGDSLVALNIDEIEQIRKQGSRQDWSAQICPTATLDDLDEEAILKAKQEFKKRNANVAHEVENWKTITFLNKAKITIQGKITRTAIILLGKPESVHFLSPSIAQISWILMDDNNVDIDAAHFVSPLILNVDKVLQKVRNLNYRYLPDNTLFPLEFTKYDSWVIREALHNCIAHQDYDLRGRINLVEKPDELLFANRGSFLPGSVEEVISSDAPPEFYRNAFLANAMVELNMIETRGGGIKKMFSTQKARYFPMPEYDITKSERVLVRISGKILDENYTRLLIKNPELDLPTVILLDKVQKTKPVSKADHKHLKSRNLVEGRYPNIYISSPIADIAGKRAQYIKNRGFDNKYYQDLILRLVGRFERATRKDIDDLLFDKLPAVLTEDQKKTKIRNLITGLAYKRGLIRNTGTRKNSSWELTEEGIIMLNRLRESDSEKKVKESKRK